MEEKITVKMTEEALYDFLLYHTYSKFSGFLINVLGVAIAIMGIIMTAMGSITLPHLALYIVIAAAFLCYTPLQLKRRAKKQAAVNREYRDPKEYFFSEAGIRTVQPGQETLYPWEKIERVVTAPKTIGIYYGKDLAFIMPKEAFGDRFVPVMQMIARNIGPENVRLR